MKRFGNILIFFIIFGLLGLPLATLITNYVVDPLFGSRASHAFEQLVCFGLDWGLGCLYVIPFFFAIVVGIPLGFFVPISSRWRKILGLLAVALVIGAIMILK